MIEETKDFGLVERLAKECGEETSLDSTSRIVKAWFYKREGKTLGSIALCKWNEAYAIDYVAALGSKKEEITKELMLASLAEAKKLGGSEAFFVRGPNSYKDFTKKFGFSLITMMEVPKEYREFTFASCAKCQKFQKECVPAPMVINLKCGR